VLAFAKSTRFGPAKLKVSPPSSLEKTSLNTSVTTAARPAILAGLPDAPQHPILAHDLVRFVGEPVAAVVAESVAHAPDARDMVEGDYDPLPAVVDLEQALGSTAPLVHPGFAGNVLSRRQHIFGEPRKAFATADHVFHFFVSATSAWRPWLWSHAGSWRSSTRLNNG
jgi:CO/xanthine dehydrogenase Mo-binding subunit